jgi:hypothetical protein
VTLLPRDHGRRAKFRLKCGLSDNRGVSTRRRKIADDKIRRDHGGKRVTTAVDHDLLRTTLSPFKAARSDFRKMSLLTEPAPSLN